MVVSDIPEPNKIKKMKGLIIGLCLGLLFSIYSGVKGQKQADNQDYQYALIEAVKQKNLGNLSEAIKLYGLVIKDKPDCAVAHYEAGSIYLATNQLDLAGTYLARAYALDPDNEWYTIAYLNSLASKENYQEALVILKEKIKNEPEKTEWEFKLAVTYFSMGKSSRAIRTLEKIEKEKGFSEKITLLKASIYESDEKYELAREEIEKVMALFPEAIQFRIVAAELCLKSGDQGAAASYYLDILEVDSLNIFALTNLTDYYRQQEDYESSYKYLAQSFGSKQIEVNRKMAILSYYLADEEQTSRYSKEISRVIEVMAETHPKESDIRLLAADFYIQIQDYPMAYGHLKEYLELQKGTYNIYMQTIMLANASGLDDELIQISTKALELYPDSADIRFFRGVAYYQTNAFETLIKNFDGIDKNKYSSPEYDAQAKMLIAEAYYRLDDFARSDSLFESLILEDPENYMVLNNYSYYLAERGEKLDKAREWSSSVVKNNPENATFLDTYAWVLYKLESFEEAEKFILFALEKGGESDPEVNEHAGDIQMALASYQLAESYYLKAIILGGDKERLEMKIEKLNSLENE
jgi:tetratricopeptide (TPR) repeat protein